MRISESQHAQLHRVCDMLAQTQSIREKKKEYIGHLWRSGRAEDRSGRGAGQRAARRRVGRREVARRRARTRLLAIRADGGRLVAAARGRDGGDDARHGLLLGRVLRPHAHLRVQLAHHEGRGLRGDVTLVGYEDAGRMRLARGVCRVHRFAVGTDICSRLSFCAKQKFCVRKFK